MNTQVNFVRGGRLWFFFFLVALVATLLFTLIITLPFRLFLDWQVTILTIVQITIPLYFVVVAVTIIKAWTQVPEKYQYIVERFGDYIDKPLDPGLHIIFPWFGWVTIRDAHFMGTQKMELYLDEKATDQYGGGDVEFKDCSSPISAFFYFEINDAQKATYNIDDVLSGIEEKADHLLRAFLGMYPIDKAIVLKSSFTPAIIASCIDLVKNPATVVTQAQFETTEFYTTLQEWGVTVKDFVISDIKLPASVKAKREEILTAEKDLEIAEIDKRTAVAKKQITITNAEGTKQATILEGQGEGEKLETILQKTGATGKDAIELMIQQTKWDAVKNTKGSVIITAGTDMPSLGAAFGAGQQLVQQPSTKP